MTLSHIIAEYQCNKCSKTHSEYASAISIPYVIAAFFGTLALLFILLRTPWNFPWFYFFFIFAGELLLLFIAGFPLSLFKLAAGGGSIVRRCPACEADMTLRGRHITKSQTPRWADYALLVLFTAVNVTLWFFYKIGQNTLVDLCVTFFCHRKTCRTCVVRFFTV
jgi:hypothetical protein